MSALRYAIAVAIGILIGVAVARAETDLPGQVGAERVKARRHCWGGSTQVFGPVVHRQSDCVFRLQPDLSWKFERGEKRVLRACGAWEGGREYENCRPPLDDWRDENGEPWTQDEISQSFGWDVGMPAHTGKDER